MIISHVCRPGTEIRSCNVRGSLSETQISQLLGGGVLVSMAANDSSTFGFETSVAALYLKVSILETLPRRRRLDVREARKAHILGGDVLVSMVAYDLSVFRFETRQNPQLHSVLERPSSNAPATSEVQRQRFEHFISLSVVPLSIIAANQINACCFETERPPCCALTQLPHTRNAAGTSELQHQRLEQLRSLRAVSL